MTDAEILNVMLTERRRCIGLVLAAYADARTDGDSDCAQRLDALATQLEHPESHPEWMPYKDA